MKIKLDELKDLTRKAILKLGYNERETATIEEVLMYAQLRGNNQGVVKLVASGIVEKPADVGEIELEKESKVSALINGSKNPAMVVINKATDIATEKSKESGIAVVGVHNINTSSGALGYYAKKIASEGLVGLIFSGSMETVAAYGSYEPIFGTNPLAIGVPTENDPLVLDMATAAMAYFGVVEANTAGRQLPEGIAYDKEGNETTDPAKALDGALRAFDKGYKGSGLSMMVQVLTGPLVGASFTGVGDSKNNWAGHLVIAIDPEVLGGKEAVREGVTKMIENVKATKKLSGVREILVPSERGDKLTKEVLKSGELEIEDNLYYKLKEVSESPK
jgi:LDH2 family malate/lactate/ureidoglycolate dehydrogenase